MKRLNQLGGNQRFEILGGRTLRENHEWWLDRVRRDANIGGKNHVPPPDRPEALPAETDDAAQAARTHLNRCGVPPRVAELLCVAPEPSQGPSRAFSERPAVAVVRGWWGLDLRFLILYGETGTGKTVAACSTFLAMRRTVRWDGGSTEDWDSAACGFWTAAELARGSHFGDEAEELRRHLEGLTLLVIDDLGVELAHEGWQSSLESLIDNRDGRPHSRTVLTTNLSCKRSRRDPNAPSPFEQRYGARIARRIRESGTVMSIDGGVHE